MSIVIKTDGGITPVNETHLETLRTAGIGFVDIDCPTEDELIEHCANATALIVLREPVTAAVIGELSRCKVIARLGAGIDNIDIEAARAQGITVTNVPDANTSEVATHALAMILSLIRRLPQFDASIRHGEWSYGRVGSGMRRIESLTLGCVGFGRIGQRVASGARALGLDVVVCDPAIDNAVVRELGYRQALLEQLLTMSDVISLHIPFTEQTRGLIDRRAISLLRDGAMVVNVSRGGLIDEDALADALASGQLSGAALDVFENEPLSAHSPFRRLPGVILTPHAAHYSHDSVDEKMTKAIEDVRRVIAGVEPLYPVDSAIWAVE